MNHHGESRQFHGYASGSVGKWLKRVSLSTLEYLYGSGGVFETCLRMPVPTPEYKFSKNNLCIQNIWTLVSLYDICIRLIAWWLWRNTWFSSVNVLIFIRGARFRYGHWHFLTYTGKCLYLKCRFSDMECNLEFYCYGIFISCRFEDIITCIWEMYCMYHKPVF